MAKKPQRKKTTGRKRRTAKSGMAAAGPSCSFPSPTRKIYSFERTLFAGTLATAVADKGWSWSFTLGQFPGATEFTQLFDLYRCTALEVTFTLVTSSTQNPVLSMVADYDSYTTPSAYDAILQRPHKRVVLTESHPVYTFRLKPRIMGVVQTSSGVGSAALAPANQWVDCNDSTVVYGGLIGWIGQYYTGSNNNIWVSTRGLFDFAMVR